MQGKYVNMYIATISTASIFTCKLYCVLHACKIVLVCDFILFQAIYLLILTF